MPPLAVYALARPAEHTTAVPGQIEGLVGPGVSPKDR
jgi:hypothetical protein